METGLQRTMSEEYYQRLMEVSCSLAKKVFLRTREKQQQKFEKLMGKKRKEQMGS